MLVGAVSDWRGDIAEAVIAARAARGWSQSDLQDAADVGYHSVAATESGTVANLNNLIAILGALDLRLEVACVPLTSPPVRWCQGPTDTDTPAEHETGETVQPGTLEPQGRAVDFRRGERPMNTWSHEALYALVRGLEHEEDRLAAIEFIQKLIWKRRELTPPPTPRPPADHGSPPK